MRILSRIKIEYNLQIKKCIQKNKIIKKNNSLTHKIHIKI